PVLITYNLVVALKEKYILRFHPNSILSAIRQMKPKEETDKLHTMQEALNDFASISALPPAKGAEQLIENIKDRLENPELEKNRGARQILRALSQKESFDPEWMKALNDPEIVETLSFNETGIFPQEFAYMLNEKYPSLNVDDVRTLDWKRISHKAEKRTINPKQMNKEVKKFEVSLKNLLKILKNQKADRHPTESNRKLIAA